MKQRERELGLDKRTQRGREKQKAREEARHACCFGEEKTEIRREQVIESKIERKEACCSWKKNNKPFRLEEG